VTSDSNPRAALQFNGFPLTVGPGPQKHRGPDGQLARGGVTQN